MAPRLVLYWRLRPERKKAIMKSNRLRGIVLLVIALAAAVAAQTGVPAAAPEGTSFDAMIAPGANYDKAEFRLWLPAAAGPVRAVVVLVPGSNGDGRPMAADPVWRDFAARRGLALLACRFTDKAHDQNFIEEYARFPGQRAGSSGRARRSRRPRGPSGAGRSAARLLGHVGRRPVRL
jgi:poly(3-hydroxybutyrate) depolymerase